MPALAQVLLLLLAASLGQTAFPEPLFMSTFPVSSGGELEQGTVEIDARITGQKFAELTARRAAHYVGPGRFLATVATYPKSRDAVKKTYLACTFLVDCDEEAVKTAARTAETELGGAKGVDALTGWVARYITKKTFSRDFDLASVVAARREGDCTEHAVLLTALIRARKIPARVVTGLALLAGYGKVFAVGHAWVEWYDGKHWLPADAALSPEELAKIAGGDKITVSYLPVRIIEREDAGYQAAFIDGPGTADISGVVVPARK
jgi:transglutaminase-like putative cysteine protease